MIDNFSNLLHLDFYFLNQDNYAHKANNILYKYILKIKDVLQTSELSYTY